MTRRRTLTELVHLTIAGRGIVITRVADPAWRWAGLIRETRLHTPPYVAVTTGVAFVTSRWGWALIWGRA